MKRFLLLAGLVSPVAYGVVGTESAPVTSPIESTAQPVRLDLPVTWQVTRARIEPSGVKAETESFRETWVLTYHRDAYATLKSPRAEVKFYPGPRRLTGGIPATILIMENDFAQLVGLYRHMGDWEATETEDEAAVEGRMLTLSLVKSDQGASFTLHLSPEEHFAINLRIGDYAQL